MGIKEIAFLDSLGNVLLINKLTSIPLKEHYIINKSVVLFRDCEPCIIHRTFIMKKFYIEIDDFFNKMIEIGKIEIPIDCFPSDLLEAIDINDKLYLIKIN